MGSGDNRGELMSFMKHQLMLSIVVVMLLSFTQLIGVIGSEGLPTRSDGLLGQWDFWEGEGQ